MSHITFPYLPEKQQYFYVNGDNEFMLAAREYAKEYSLDSAMPNASVLVKNGTIIGRGANGSTYHETHECERVKQGIPTGQGYELCEGCHPKNHSEPSAIADALKKEHTVSGSILYLWGHWWCCEYCWNVMLSHEVAKVYLLTDSQVLFNKAHPENMVGRQFEIEL